MSGLGGGGGFIMIYEAKSRTVHTLDYVGHTPQAADPTAFWTWHVGGVHAIARDPDTGVLSAGADPRRDGQAVAF